VSNIFYFIAIIFNLLIWLYLLVKYKTLLPSSYFIFCFLIELLLYLFVSSNSCRRYPLLGLIVNSFIIGQFVFMISFMLQQFPNCKTLFIALGISTLSIAIFIYLKSGILVQLNTIALTLFAFIIIALCLCYFIFRILQPNAISILKDYTFYIVLAEMLWNLTAICNFIPLLLFSQLDANFMVFMDNVFNIVNINTYSLFSISGIWLIYQKKLKSLI
jgi:hypothetical protein